MSCLSLSRFEILWRFLIEVLERKSRAIVESGGGGLAGEEAPVTLDARETTAYNRIQPTAWTLTSPSAAANVQRGPPRISGVGDRGVGDSGRLDRGSGAGQMSHKKSAGVAGLTPALHL